MLKNDIGRVEENKPSWNSLYGKEYATLVFKKVQNTAYAFINTGSKKLNAFLVMKPAMCSIASLNCIWQPGGFETCKVKSYFYHIQNYLTPFSNSNIRGKCYRNSLSLKTKIAIVNTKLYGKNIYGFLKEEIRNQSHLLFFRISNTC